MTSLRCRECGQLIEFVTFEDARTETCADCRAERASASAGG